MREKILAHLRSHHYRPLRLRRLAHFFDVAEEDYAEFRSLVKNLIREGEVAVGFAAGCALHYAIFRRPGPAVPAPG